MTRDTYYLVSTLYILGIIVAPHWSVRATCLVAALYNVARMEGWL